MKFALVLLFAAAAAASSLQWTLNEKGNDVKDKQYEINGLYSGLVAEDRYSHVPVEFPLNGPQFYTEPKALEKFLQAWDEGFITKDSTFSLYSYKNRHDTYRLFDIFYFAKDYDTFIKLAKWAKSELHPLQFVYAFTAALYHRKDTAGVVIPSFYEILPHYFVQADIVQGVYKANILGVKTRKFNVNNTGFEYSWYKSQTLQSYKSGSSWNPYDFESRMAYYTEDVDLANYVTKAVFAFAPWMSDEKYPDIDFSRKGEVLFDHYKYLLKKYNLERYANGLPPIRPLNFKSPIRTGYNPHLMTLHGHPFTPRPDGMTPLWSNPEGINGVLNTKKRYDDVTDLLGYWNPLNNSVIKIDSSVGGLNALGSLVYGNTNPQIRALYKPYHYQIFEALDNAVRASNDVGNTGSVLSNYLTEMRDPVYYRALASVNEVFKNYFTKLEPYTHKELGFPGVKIADFEFGKLETYCEDYEYDITNSVPVKKNNEGYHYTAVVSRLNHKPFNFKFTINSDKDQDAMVRFFLTPAYDANMRELGVAEKLEHAVNFFMFNFKISKGTKTYSGQSDQGYYGNSHSMANLNQLIKKHQSSNQPFYAPTSTRCSVPSNLMLPKGSKAGIPYTVMAIVTPYHATREQTPGPCGWGALYGTEQTLDFPTNRKVVSSYFEDLDNIYFKDVNIFHTEHSN